MKNTMVKILVAFFLVISLLPSAQAEYNFSETWSVDLRSQVKVECRDSTLCEQLCNDQNTCVIKNSTCKDCISTGVKMTYFFSSIGKEIVTNHQEVTAYEFIDFLINGKFIAFTASNVYNQFDSVQSNALAKKFKLLCPNDYESPMAFFHVEKRELELNNAKYVTCGTKIYELVNNAEILE